MNFNDFLSDMKKYIDKGDRDGFWKLCESHPDLADTFITLEERYGSLKAKAQQSTADPEEGFRKFLQLICEQEKNN